MNDGGGGDDGSEEESFEYTDDDQSNEEGEVAMENSYYNAKAAKETDLAEAEEMFLKVIAMEREELQRASGDGKGEGEQKQLYGPWSFKSMKQLVKCHLASNDTQKAMDRYDELLRCVASGSALSQNAVEKGVNSMLERVAALYQGSASSGPSGRAGPDADIHKALARSVYDSTIRVFHPQTGTSPNERLWFKTLLKYGQLLYEMNETAKLQIHSRSIEGIGSTGSRLRFWDVRGYFRCHRQWLDESFRDLRSPDSALQPDQGQHQASRNFRQGDARPRWHPSSSYSSPHSRARREDAHGVERV